MQSFIHFTYQQQAMYVSGFHHTKEQLETSEMLGEHHFDILIRRKREENMNIPLAQHSQLLTRERHRAGGAAAPLGQNPSSASSCKSWSVLALQQANQSHHCLHT